MSLPGTEIVGARSRTLVGRLPADPLTKLWTRTASGIVKRGFVMEYRDLEPPRTGIFDGLRIVIDPDVDFEMQCFVLLHLFGHSVQWVAPTLAPKLESVLHNDDKAAFIRALRAYEYEAAQFGMRLLHDCSIHDLDQWYSDFVATDWRYVERYYEEGKIPPWEECLVAGAPLIRPVAIPPLAQRLVEVRYAF
jgi:hypothetical protein